MKLSVLFAAANIFLKWEKQFRTYLKGIYTAVAPLEQLIEYLLIYNSSIFTWCSLLTDLLGKYTLVSVVLTCIDVFFPLLFVLSFQSVWMILLRNVLQAFFSKQRIGDNCYKQHFFSLVTDVELFSYFVPKSNFLAHFNISQAAPCAGVLEALKSALWSCRWTEDLKSSCL